MKAASSTHIWCRDLSELNMESPYLLAYPGFSQPCKYPALQSLVMCGVKLSARSSRRLGLCGDERLSRQEPRSSSRLSIKFRQSHLARSATMVFSDRIVTAIAEASDTDTCPDRTALSASETPNAASRKAWRFYLRLQSHPFCLTHCTLECAKERQHRHPRLLVLRTEVQDSHTTRSSPSSAR